MKPCAAIVAGAIGARSEQHGERTAELDGLQQRLVDDDGPALVLDELGRIRSYTSAVVALLGGKVSAEPLGQPIARLLPALPIREATPGYNIAYVAFWFGQGDWWAYEAVDREGRSVALAVAVEPIDRADGGGYLVSLWPLRSSAALDLDLR